MRVGNSNLFAAPSRTGLEGCWIVGDSTFPGQGTVACALSGLNAWRDISGETL
jgi:phytoene dehydrogenase-like protein